MRFKNLVAVMLVLFCSTALAQQTGSIAGTVSESGGGALPGVTVEARSNVLPQARVVTTASGGGYRLSALPPGDYTVTFSLAGMATESRNVRVNLGQETVVNATMGVQAMAEEITVMAETPMIDPTTTEIESAVSVDVIELVPNGQSYRDLMKLAPAVQYSEDTIRGPSAGGSGQDNVYKFDGVNVTLPLFGTLSAEPSSHDIDQVNYMKGGAKATDFNRAGGFSMDSVSKSGTSEWKGQIEYQVQLDSMTEDQESGALSIYDEDRTWATVGVGGPILAERLYFYGSYFRPTRDRANSSNAYGEVPDYESTRNEYFGKLTFTPTNRILLHGSYRDSDREDLFASIGGTEAATAGRTDEDNLSIAIVEGSWLTTDRSYATFKYTDYSQQGTQLPNLLLDVVPSTTVGATLDLNNLDRMGYFTVPAPVTGQTAYNQFIVPYIERYGYVGASGARVGGGFVGAAPQINDIGFFRESAQIGYDITLGNVVTHDIHLGFQRYTDGEDLGRASNAWGIITVPGGRVNCPAGTPCAGQPVFFQAEFQRTTGGATGQQVIHSEFESNNFEINDTIQWGNWAFNVGVLLSEDRLFGQGLREDSSTASGYVNSPGTKYEMYKVDYMDQVQPRLGATWAYNGVDTVYGSYARYNPAANSLPRAASWDRNTLGLTFRTFFDAEGRQIGSQQIASSTGKLFADDLESRYTDEFMLGTAKQFNTRWSARAYARYRYSTNFWEDTQNNARLLFQPPEGVPRELYIPDLAARMTQIGTGGGVGSYVIAELDGAFTKHEEVSLESEYRATDRTFLRGSYTWSHYYGNMDQDNTTTVNDQSIFIGSSFIADGAGRQIWDNKEGDLRSDRPHLLKLYGYHTLPWNASVGTFALYQSGHAWEAWSYQPYVHLTSSTSDANRYAEPAGSRRTDDHYQLDLNYTQNFPIAGNVLQLIVDAFNVTDNQTGYNPQPSLNLATFGQPRSYYAPRRFQIAARFQF